LHFVTQRAQLSFVLPYMTTRDSRQRLRFRVRLSLN